MKNKDLKEIYLFLKKFQTMSLKEQNKFLNKFEKVLQKRGDLSDK